MSLDNFNLDDIPEIPANAAIFDPRLDRGPIPGGREWLPASSFEGLPVPPREWLVKDMIPSRTVTLFAGDGGTGKSLLSLQLAFAVATGRRWLGRDVARGLSLFLSAEDDEAELHRRLDAISIAEATPLGDVPDLMVRSLAGLDALLATLAGKAGTLTRTKLFEEIDGYLDAHAPALLVLDTLADLYPGDENNRAQARQFVGMLRGLAIRHDCAIVMLSHPSLTGLNSGSGTSGSTAWNNSVRSRLYLSRVIQDGYEPNPDARVLTTKKSNYGRTGGDISLHWSGGVFIADEPMSAGEAMNAGIKAEAVFMRLLRLLTEQGRHVNASGGTSYAPRVFADHPDAQGISKRAFTQAMEELLRAGKISMRHQGPPSKRTTYIVEGAQE